MSRTDAFVSRYLLSICVEPLRLIRAFPHPFCNASFICANARLISARKMRVEDAKDAGQEAVKKSCFEPNRVQLG